MGDPALAIALSIIGEACLLVMRNPMAKGTGLFLAEYDKHRVTCAPSHAESFPAPGRGAFSPSRAEKPSAALRLRAGAVKPASIVEGRGS